MNNWTIQPIACSLNLSKRPAQIWPDPEQTENWLDRPGLPMNSLNAVLKVLELPETAKLLLIGIGNGRLAAHLAKKVAHLFVLDQDEMALNRFLERALVQGFRNISGRVGNGHNGWSEFAPFERIVWRVTRSSWSEVLANQLQDGGTLVALEGGSTHERHLVRYTRVRPGLMQREDYGAVRLVPRLGELLVASGFMQENQVIQALAECRKSKERLGEYLVRNHFLGEQEVYKSLAHQFVLPFHIADDLVDRIDVQLWRKVPQPFMDHHQILPLFETDRDIWVASCQPQSDLSGLQFAFPGQVLTPILVTPSDWSRLRRTLHVLGHEAIEPAVRPKKEINLRKTDLPDAHLISLFEAMVLDAIGRRASDIHLERYGDRTRVRYRVDGDLRDIERFTVEPKEVLGLLNVIKIKSNLDIAERRLPQGGRVHIQYGEKQYDLRVQTQPTLHGEYSVLRILPQSQKVLTVEQLGFPEDVAKTFRRLLDSPSGLILVVGPTGSGKTTSLYAGLQRLAADPTRKVITVEDPIEYALDQIQQTQVQPEIGFSFAQAMRSFVRQDPDVILVGEIRDNETALEAIRASQTGHVVLSTLHCNDAVDAVQRLLDLGMRPNSIASELLAVLAQRLARKICSQCRVWSLPEPEIAEEVFPRGLPDGFSCYRGAGCEYCHGFGVYGRTAIVEFLSTESTVRRAIAHSLPVDELRKEAIKAGLRPLRRHALEAVQAGLTPFSELPWLLPIDRLAEET